MSAHLSLLMLMFRKCFGSFSEMRKISAAAPHSVDLQADSPPPTITKVRLRFTGGGESAWMSRTIGSAGNQWGWFEGLRSVVIGETGKGGGEGKKNKNKKEVSVWDISWCPKRRNIFFMKGIYEY